MLSCARARPKRAPQADAHMQDLDAGSVCSLGAITCWSPAELQDARDVSCHRSSHQSGTPWPIWMPLWLTKSASGTRSKLRSSLDHSVDGRPAEADARIVQSVGPYPLPRRDERAINIPVNSAGAAPPGTGRTTLGTPEPRLANLGRRIYALGAEEKAHPYTEPEPRERKPAQDCTPVGPSEAHLPPHSHQSLPPATRPSRRLGTAG